MTDYVESGIRLIGDTDDASSKMEDLISLADDIDNLAPTLTVDTEVGDTAAIDDVTALDGETISTEIDTVEGGDKVGGKSLLTTIHELGINPVQVIMNVAGTILDVLSAVNSFAVTPLLEAEVGMAKFGAQTGVTGDELAKMEGMIRTIFMDDLGQSIEEVTNVAIAAQQLHLPVEEATRAALTFTHAFSDQDPKQAVTTMGNLLKLNLVDNMQQAADLMTVFFQQGGNNQGDALTTVNSYAQSWSDMGLTLQEALSAVTTLMNGSGASAGEAARMVQTLDDSLTTAAANAASPQAEMLTKMGLENPKDKGQAMGADFIDGFAAAFTNLPADQQDLASQLFMGKGGKKFTGAIGDMTTEFGPFQNYVDAANAAATEIDNSLTGALDDFIKGVQQAATDFLSSEAIDLPGKIAALKTGLQDALATLQSGGSLDEAITVALQPIGLDSLFERLEGILGNLVISMLEVVASIQEVTRNFDAAAATRRTIAGMEATQLPFDLQIANADDIASTIQLAVRRGVTPEDITSAVGTAVSELVSSGATEQAQALLDQFAAGVPSVIESVTDEGASGQTSIVVKATAQLTPEAISDLQKQIDDAKISTSLSTPGAGFGAQGQGGATPIDLDALKQKTTDAATAVTSQTTATDTLKTSTDTLTTSTDAATTATTAQSTETTALATNLGLANLATGDFATGLYDTLAAYEANTAGMTDAEKEAYIASVQMQALSDATHDFSINAATAVQGMRDAASAASSAGDTTAHPGKKATGGSFRGLSWVGEQGPELIGSGQTLSVLNNRTSRALMQALSGMPYMHYGDSGGGKNVSVTVNNNVQNLAQANAISYDIGQQVRGF